MPNSVDHLPTSMLMVALRPQDVGLRDYLASLDRTSQALKDLRQTNLRSNQDAISDLRSLLRIGTQQLENVFSETLRSEQDRVEPLNYLIKGLEFPRIPSEKISQLRLLNAHIALSTAQSAQSGGAYVEVRGEYISKTLETLAIATMNSTRKTNPDEIYSQGSNGLGYYTAGMEKAYMAEYDNICAIFAQDEWGRVFTATCRRSLARFTTVMQDLDEYIRAHLITDCFLAYEAVNLISMLAVQLDMRTGELRQPLMEALNPVRETAKASLSRLLNYVKTQVTSIASLSGDGAAAPVVAETMTRLQTMVAYLEPLGSVLASIGDKGWAPSEDSAPGTPALDVGADGRELFTSYATDTVETLLTALEGKSKALHKNKSVLGIFMANNATIIERMIRSSELAPLLSDYVPKLEATKRKHLKLYTAEFDMLGRYLQDTQYTNRNRASSGAGAPSGVDSATVVKKLSSKDRDAVKEKFRMFNSQFEELVAKHKTYAMEKEVRQQCAVDITKVIEPLYGRFWDRYHDVDKGKGKYVHFDKASLGNKLAALG